MLARVLSSAVIGIDAYQVEVEVDITKGLPSCTIVGLPEIAVKESKERVKAAISNSGYKFPYDRLTVNLAPADIKKEGTGFDLPIALGILTANQIIPENAVTDFFVLGELSLDGRVKGIKGSLPMALAAKAENKHIIVPHVNGEEASIVQGISVYPVRNLAETVEFLKGGYDISPAQHPIKSMENDDPADRIDFAEVMGQENVKRAMEIAAAGGHNIIMIGPPGSGKTMLAKRLPTILPRMTFDEAIETTKIFSVAGMLRSGEALIVTRPFRTPHHTISDVGLIGGGRFPKPGEVSLAHNGVLFLDELPEFKKSVLEVLRQPLEDQVVTISRALTTIRFPSSFMLVGAMNPCSCGFFGDLKHECRCSPNQVQRYRTKISGPLMDRIDIHVDVPAVAYQELMREETAEPSSEIRKRVSFAREIQTQRFQKTKIHCNAQMGSRHVRAYCRVDQESSRLLETAIDKLGLSARAYNRVLKIARTIADMAGKEDVGVQHISEAIQYRSLDRKGF